ncbi:DUF5686 and carboxypeptidase regulatory-like domain-containing protein [Bacteroidota bacterium]
MQFISNLAAQKGIKGFIFDKNGKSLAYATIYIKELKTGTVANINGYFEYPLKSGTYHIEFRHLGYQSESKVLTISKGFIAMNIYLSDQFIQLREVNIVSTSEDPAYAVMRKAIAAARYYRMLVKSFDAKVYIKGSGEVKVPSLVYMFAKSEGVDTAEYFVSETLSEIHYEYPATYNQRVLSARNNDQDTGMYMVNNFVNASIYEPLFAGVVSPLSPSAFTYYRFKLLNIFTDKEVEIYHIDVIPRSKGTGVFTGSIYIIKHKWNVYSIDLKTWMQGFEINVKQMFAQVNEKMWFPVNQQFDVEGKLLGFEINYKYLTSMSEYEVELNDTLSFENLVLIDEKTEKEYALALKEEKKLKNNQKPSAIPDINEDTDEDEYTIRDFKKQMKEYEKNARKQNEEPEVISDYSVKIDSLAFNKDQDFWDSIRPIPLTENEKKPGLSKKMDSIAAVKESDTISAKGLFGDVLGGLIFGSKIKLSKSWRFNYPSLLARTNFNTVEGFNVEIPLKLSYKSSKDTRLSFGPEFRYGFTEKLLRTSAEIKYEFPVKMRKKDQINVQGGSTISQYYSGNPILPILNTITSLFAIRNHMKIYQKDFIKIRFEKSLSDKLILKTSVEWAERQSLQNNTDYSWVAKKGRKYTYNAPFNIEESNTAFEKHKAFIVDLRLEFKPNVKYRKSNGIKIPVYSLNPVFALDYSGGLPDIFSSQIDFHRFEASIRHSFTVFRNQLDIHLFGGDYLSNNMLYFPDFKHFQGNQTLIQKSDPMNTYQLLDYYKYSTMSSYAGGHLQLAFNRFLLTRIFWLNITGVRENLTVNYLVTKNSPHYLELGYGLDNFARFFKIEAFTAFEDGKYYQFGIRLGLSGIIQIETP